MKNFDFLKIKNFSYYTKINNKIDQTNVGFKGKKSRFDGQPLLCILSFLPSNICWKDEYG